ncbi:EAL domain-containing response regulator [Oceanimonas doudoroffii]|uniref:Diguanylate phosphodiesterase n=1 Tax=Oceanimonas doudoroffii TaxID=84158 RepID=A0A233RJ04_9GAMM|nr:EAL domain-containing response regulator [Oceanimonas doudoroffii]OXY83376.1 hypothetical protein B6S08_07795 [Oceanimonas doudoroffii]
MDTGIEVLVIDDDIVTLKLLVGMLNRLEGCMATGCTSARRALARMNGQETSPDMVFLDINMPEMDGFSFIRKLEELGFNGALVLVSGHDQKIMRTAEELSKACHLRVAARLEKPVSFSTLQALMEETRRPFAHPDRHCRDELAKDLPSALQRREFFNVYQPKVALTNGAIAGVEALVRWRHPRCGILSPDHFITLAEQQGHIDALTRLVMENALHDSRLWLEKSQPFSVSVNVSMLSLMSPNFMNGMCALVLERGFSPSDFIFEVTEGRVLEDTRAPLEITARIKMAGFGLSMDDFGTGYSNMNRLRDYPFDELKLDRSFVTGITSSPATLKMCHASIALAQACGIRVVAEGIESRDEFQILKQMGCDYAQGYFICRPMTAEAMKLWLSAHWFGFAP